MTFKTAAAFKKKCESLLEEIIGCSVYFPDESPTLVDACVEDDGYLHVTRKGVRACFDVAEGQSLSWFEQNERTRRVMEGLGLAKFIDDKVLVEEYGEDEEECCPHCGRSD